MKNNLNHILAILLLLLSSCGREENKGTAPAEPALRVTLEDALRFAMA